MQIKLTSVMVDDQEKALRFYTTILGFVKKTDIPMGHFRWLTVSSPEGVEGVELVLEPMGFSTRANLSAGSVCRRHSCDGVHLEGRTRRVQAPQRSWRQVSKRT